MRSKVRTTSGSLPATVEAFAAFAEDAEPRLKRALVAPLLILAIRALETDDNATPR